MTLNQEEVLAVEDFKRDFSAKFGYVPLITIEKTPEKVMPLSELEEFFKPFIARKYDKKITLSSNLRDRELVEYKIIYSMMAKELGYTLTAIAKHLKKDHTTIVHYNKTFRNLMATSDLFNEKYNEVVVYIKSSK